MALQIDALVAVEVRDGVFPQPVMVLQLPVAQEPPRWCREARMLRHCDPMHVLEHGHVRSFPLLLVGDEENDGLEPTLLVLVGGLCGLGLVALVFLGWHACPLIVVFSSNLLGFLRYLPI